MNDRIEHSERRVRARLESLRLAMGCQAPGAEVSASRLVSDAQVIDSFLVEGTVPDGD